MAINRKITEHPTPYPDKDTQTPSEFNSAVDSHLEWEANEFVPDVNEWANQCNTTQDEINTSESNASTYKTDAYNWAERAKDDSYTDSANNTGYSAYHYKEYAKTYEVDAHNWAEADEDTEYTDSSGNTGYSAYHWAQKSAKGERLTATSNTEVTIGTGSKTFTLNEGYRAFISGSRVHIADNTDPSNNFMVGSVTGYDSGTDELVVDVATTGGSGTISDWSIGLRAGGDADTVDGIDVNTTATANELLALDANAKLPTSITGDSDTVDGFHLDQDVTSGSSPTFDGYLNESSNLSDLDNVTTSRSNLGLGTAAERDYTISTSSPSGGSDGDVWYQV